MRGYCESPAIPRTAPAIPFSGAFHSPEDADFRLPNIREVRTVQDKHKVRASRDTVQAPSKLLLAKGAAWIPSDAVNLKL